MSQTAMGRLSTITDNIKTLFRQTGMGILEALKPRLETIVQWFNENKRTVERWKESLVRFGREGAERFLGFFDQTFTRFDRMISNPEFQRLDFWGKVNFVWSDITSSLQTWLQGEGGQTLTEMGRTVASFIGQGLAAMAPTLGKTFAEALWEGIKSDPIVAGLIGVVLGAPFGPWGAAFGGAAAFNISTWYNVGRRVNQLMEQASQPPGATVPSPFRPVPGTPIPGTPAAERAVQMAPEVQVMPTVPIGAAMTVPAHKPSTPEDISRLLTQTAFAQAKAPSWAERWRIPGHALGGLFNTPHLGLVAEGGPEVVIPLSSTYRARALDLWVEAGEALGVEGYREGGFTSRKPAATSGGGGPTVNNFYLDGAVQASIEVKSEADIDRVANEAGMIVARSLRNILRNMP